MSDKRENNKISKSLFRVFDRITYYLGPDLIFLFILVTVLIILSLIYGNEKFTPVKKSVMVPLVVFSGILLFGVIARVRLIFSGQKEKVKELFTLTMNMARDWFPLLLIILIYENLHDLTDLIHPETLDGRLAELDLAIFGVQPTIWLQKFVHPLLNDYMTFAYGLYFLYPATILG
ncbi:MAG: hypothetical protein N3B13_01255, partial [Deltaproteobacteria bacterium]|nr:hypothetical protein [Deltaproteobacteria bacterium]